MGKPAPDSGVGPPGSPGEDGASGEQVPEMSTHLCTNVNIVSVLQQ